MTKIALGNNGISYDEVDLTTSAAALEYVQEELGYSADPVVVDNADEQNHWSGFRPDKIDALTGKNCLGGLDLICLDELD
ncbi:glutaredoxin-like protein [Arthrobacter ulcerisalmonis]|uniref:Glutaredoxin-like protein n=2 Tax=Arthrobacter ulcerisalmonis TaxID=2483813 RepID=A0A3P5X677_9MICC|nr:glutaredoxin-like protein [Arthrobacter ulcerisalmonis]